MICSGRRWGVGNPPEAPPEGRSTEDALSPGDFGGKPETSIGEVSGKTPPVSDSLGGRFDEAGESNRLGCLDEDGEKSSGPSDGLWPDITEALGVVCVRSGVKLSSLGKGFGSGSRKSAMGFLAPSRAPDLQKTNPATSAIESPKASRFFEYRDFCGSV